MPEGGRITKVIGGNMGACLICGLESKKWGEVPPWGVEYDCPRCGQITVSQKEAKDWSDWLETQTSKDRIRINASHWIRREHIDTVSWDIFNRLKNIKSPSFHEKSDLLLLGIEKETSYAGEHVVINDDKWLAIAWSQNHEELNEIVDYLALTKRINRDLINAKIAPEGWKYIENLKSINQESLKGFVAMRFSDNLKDIFENGIQVGIESAGYKPLRIDRKDHNNKICDEIIAEIRSSRFIVADLTGQDQGVYFEAGFAMGLNIPVFWTCKKDDFQNMHFDIRQYNCILWENVDELKENLRNRIIAAIGKGPLSDHI